MKDDFYFATTHQVKRYTGWRQFLAWTGFIAIPVILFLLLQIAILVHVTKQQQSDLNYYQKTVNL